MGVGASRPLLEARVEARVRALLLAFLDGCDIVGLAATPDGRRVTAARVLRQAGAAEQVLDADLVVDACRPRHGPRCGWRRSGTRGRSRTAVPSPGSATPPGPTACRPTSSAATSRSWTPPRPKNPRGGALLALEGGRWIVTLARILGDFPPTDPDGFLSVRPLPPLPRHPPGDPGRRAAGRPVPFLPGQRPPPL